MVTAATVEKALGRRPSGSSSELSLAEAVRGGLPVAALERLITTGVVDERIRGGSG